MAKLFVRIALGVALVVCVGSLRADGEKSDKGDTGDKKGAPTVKMTPTEKGRESKIHVYLPTPEAKLYFDETDDQGHRQGAARSALRPWRMASATATRSWQPGSRTVAR